MKVGLGELKEQLKTPEETSISNMQIAKQAINKKGQKFFPDFQARRR